MPVNVLRNKIPQQVHSDISGFSPEYAEHWRAWLAAPAPARPEMFAKILRKWQAVRPKKIRRLRDDTEAAHVPPFLDDLLGQSEAPIAVLANLSLLTIARRTENQKQALSDLWQIFSQLPTEGISSCVGITKAILLLTDGRIGPAFDSRVRKELRIAAPTTCAAWLVTLEEIADDIAAFEAAHGSFVSAAPKHFAHLSYGRLYDMAFGPR